MSVPHFNCWSKQQADKAGETMDVRQQSGIPITTQGGEVIPI